MELKGKKKKLFDESYSDYIKITDIIQESCSNDFDNPFQDKQSSLDLICSLDLYLQGVLLKIGVSDNLLSPEELEFIQSLPDEQDSLFSKIKGYRRFIKHISVESFNNDSSKFFNFSEIPQFILFLKEKNESECEDVINLLEKILNRFIAIDERILPCENEIAVKSIKLLKSCISNNKKNKRVSKKIKKDELENKNSLDEAIKELEDMIGLEDVKNEVLTSINMIKINIMRREKGLPELVTSNHMVFTGQPGTGKTTVARIMAKIYKALGIVSKGQLIETDRAGMVAGYVGQTALKTTQVIKTAIGGVLFIDEAYSLSSEDGSNDYGKEAIDTLVKAMEDNRDNLVVIVAGYTEEMKKFIDMNPGLRSRFNKYINFANYSTNELLEIFKRQCEKVEFILTPKAIEKAKEYFSLRENDETFGNARGVRNYFDCIARNQATRIVSLPNPSEKEIRIIKEEDLDNITIQ